MGNEICCTAPERQHDKISMIIPRSPRMRRKVKTGNQPFHIYRPSSENTNPQTNSTNFASTKTDKPNK